jgi:hypothetical protein
MGRGRSWLVGAVVAGLALTGAGTAAAAPTATPTATPGAVAPAAAAESPTPPGALTVGCPGSTLTLPAALAAAPSGGTVKVCAGTYPGGLAITKPVTLLGARAGVDARSGRAVPATESVIAAGVGSGIVVANATGVRIDGFTITGAGGSSTAGVLSVAGGSGLTVTNSVISKFAFGVNFFSNGSPSAITRNRFADNDAAGGQAGVFVSSGPATDTTISENLFTGTTGSAAAAVNTAGDPARHSQRLRIERNQSIDDATFAVVTNADGIVVANNQIVRRAGTPGVGTGILVGGATTNAQVTGNVLTGGAANGITVSQAFSAAPNTGISVAGNTVIGRTNGIRFVGQTSGSVTANTVLQSSGTGILLEGANAGVTVRGNRSLGGGLTDCSDAAAPANTWAGNVGVRSTPAGLCTLF